MKHTRNDWLIVDFYLCLGFIHQLCFVLYPSSLKAEIQGQFSHCMAFTFSNHILLVNGHKGTSMLVLVPNNSFDKEHLRSIDDRVHIQFC